MKPTFVLSLIFLSLAGAATLLARKGAQGVRNDPTGSVSFAKAITLKSPVLYSYSIAAGDLNHDGIPDLAVVGIEFPFLEHALGKGNGHVGRWSDQGGSGYAPSFVMFADMDLDGNLDALTNDASQRQVVISFGDGHGNFPVVKRLDSGAGYATNYLAVADLNGDGIPDIVGSALSSGRDFGEVFVLLGKGNREFQKPLHFPSGGHQASAVAVGDLNNDGIPDLVVANTGTDNRPFDYDVAVLLGKGDGTFGSPVRYHAGVRPYQLAMGDFNGDGNLDVAVVPINGKSSIFVLLGKGDGTFGEAKGFQSDLYPLSIVAADFNGDGILDLAVTNYTSPKQCHVSVLLGNGDGSFQKPIRFPVGLSPSQLVVADFNHDGKPDIATINGGDATISILLNTTP